MGGLVWWSHCGLQNLGLKGGVGERDVVRVKPKGSGPHSLRFLWSYIAGSHGHTLVAFPLQNVSIQTSPPFVRYGTNVPEEDVLETEAIVGMTNSLTTAFKS